VFCVNGRGRGRSPLTLGGRRGRRTGIRALARLLENIIVRCVLCVGGRVLRLDL
jgi:hypothetical protein